MTPAVFGGPIRTERLVLRMMVAEDLDDMLVYQGDEGVCRYLPYEAQSREQVAEAISRHSVATTLAKDGDYWRIAVELAGSDGAPARVIGDIYFALRSTANSGGTIGWVFAPDVQAHGYAREAASAVLDRAFGDVGLHRVIAELDPRNERSASLCRALGMRGEALFVEDIVFRGEWADTNIYAILASEWHARSR